MHNRVRMVTASFLVKHLLIHWQHGAAWFWDTLVDADLASNSASCEWVAGGGAYVRRFVPELAALPDKWLHKPWEAPAPVLHATGITLGETYPAPMIDLQRGRDRALAAFSQIRKAA